MAPQPVRVADGTWELLAVYDVGEGDTDADGHATRKYRLYAGVVKDCGEVGVARVDDQQLCERAYRRLLERFG